LVSATKKPTFAVEDVEKIPTTPGKNSALPADLEDPSESGVTTGRIRSSMDLD